MNKARAKVSAYNEQKKLETLQQLEEAILYFRKNNLPINRKTLASECGFSRTVMYKPHVKEFLLRQPEFNSALVDGPNPLQLSNLEAEILDLKEKLKQVKTNNKLLKAEIDQLKLKLNSEEDRYQKLLGEYQLRIGDKIIPF